MNAPFPCTYYTTGKLNHVVMKLIGSKSVLPRLWTPHTSYHSTATQNTRFQCLLGMKNEKVPCRSFGKLKQTLNQVSEQVGRNFSSWRLFSKLWTNRSVNQFVVYTSSIFRYLEYFCMESEFCSPPTTFTSPLRQLWVTLTTTMKTFPSSLSTELQHTCGELYCRSLMWNCFVVRMLLSDNLFTKWYRA